MKLGLFTLMLSVSGLFYAQDNKGTSDSNAFTSGSAKVEKFNNNARRFNDWSISLGGGTAFLHHSDLTSFNKDGKHFGWNAYAELGKQISDKFGLILQYQKGETKQTGRLGQNVWGASPAVHGLATATTKYDQISLLGDFNFSNLFRRIDNNSPFRWALHGYAGIGFQAYSYERKDQHPTQEANRDFKQKLGIESFFYQGGVGVKYNVSKRIDLEARAMYIIPGDDEFDGGGETVKEWPGYNQIVKNTSDNLMTINLGVTFKLGKHNQHLAWYDSYNTALDKLSALASRPTDFNVCDKGDADNDGVCDDWDRELNTPIGARVDGSGKALDMDFDGVIDLKDKCVTVPGLVENYGCPYIDENTLVI
jgi:OOP family OmpA-OmpF porin